jgi:hypothetical protein
MRAAHDNAGGRARRVSPAAHAELRGFTFDISYVPRHRAWLMDVDQREVYARYRDNLRMIGAGDGRRWVLECPGHRWALDAPLRCGHGTQSARATSTASTAMTPRASV